ncbi:MAG: aspartate ammonia-lyase [Pirellulaceae bacterium]
MLFRTESDLLGSLPVPAAALYGVHTQRALENFPLSGRPVSRNLVHAFGMVKLACARTNHELGHWPTDKYAAMERACLEMAEGRLDDHIVVDALQGGAGTSTNMNVNEVLANRALLLLGLAPGEYDIIHPLNDLNLHQSTNDTFPTALKIAAIEQLRRLERDVTALLEAFQRQEHALANIVKVARTQLQDAVLTTLGRSMGAYADAIARDRWRIYKCEERLRVVNLGGTAIGTGLGAPRTFIFRVIDHLQQITGMGLARAENLIDATQNLDVLVEVSGMLRTLACNLLKISNDLRLLASGPDAGLGELRLPPRQAGSSIMPGKVNPVILEAVGQAALSISAHDQALASACSLGNLELNQFLPLIADCLLTNLDLARNTCRMFVQHCLDGLQANPTRCARYVNTSTATLTALVDRLGYSATEEVARCALEQGHSIRQIVLDRELLTADEFDRAVAPEVVTQLGTRTSRGAEGGT